MSGLLKFITCGSVDDGKSTLIGHILYDSKLLYADQEKALELDSKVGSRGGAIDYSLLLDGLMAEREQGITIDVAYRYFTTEKRSFIVADTPGHEEYTRNMAVGASFADLAVILVDAKQGVLVQTRRHARICALMGIRYFVFAVNKMDLVDYSEERFKEIVDQIQELSKELHLASVKIIPVSATEGDNVTTHSDNMPWYTQEPLLAYLENIDVSEKKQEEGELLGVEGLKQYFRKNGINRNSERTNTELYLFSTLPPTIRIEVLEDYLQKDSNALVLEKLSKAYGKADQLEKLKEYVVTEPSDIREWVKEIVPTYQPKEE